MTQTAERALTMREAFTGAVSELIDEDPRVALVLADISRDAFVEVAARHPDRMINVGIREQLMIGTAAGLALTGLRPIAHSYATFLVDRAYEQIKLDLGHQGLGAVLVSIGASYDAAAEGYTHMSPMDVALLDTLPGWTVRVPGHAGEVAPLLRAALGHDEPVYLRLSMQGNGRAMPAADQLTVLRHGSGALVIAIGPMLDPVLQATEGLDVTVAYTHTVRPFDQAGLGALGGAQPDVVLVEPYLEGTSARIVAQTFPDRPFRLRCIGVKRQDLHRYGSSGDHARWHGLDPASIRARLLDG